LFHSNSVDTSNSQQAAQKLKLDTAIDRGMSLCKYGLIPLYDNKVWAGAHLRNYTRLANQGQSIIVEFSVHYTQLKFQHNGQSVKFEDVKKINDGVFSQHATNQWAPVFVLNRVVFPKEIITLQMPWHCIARAVLTQPTFLNHIMNGTMEYPWISWGEGRLQQQVAKFLESKDLPVNNRVTMATAEQYIRNYF
jgi:hypothetical protein